MSLFVKQLIHWIGTSLAVTGGVFVMLKLNDYSSALDFSRFSCFTWAVLFIFALVYGLANIILALAWRNILMYFGANVTRLWASRVFGLTQLAKYIPGNIMHLASRQAMGLAGGVGGWPLAKASIWELGLIAIAGAFFVILELPFFLPYVTVPMAIAGFISVLLLIGLGLMRTFSLVVVRAFLGYVVFLCISGVVFTGVLSLVIGISLLTPAIALNFSSAFVVAWLAGLITPGSPAGVGVRELVIVVLLKGAVAEADLLLAALLSRIVTVSGDVILFLLASLLPKNRSTASCNDTNI